MCPRHGLLNNYHNKIVILKFERKSDFARGLYFCAYG